MPDDRYFARPTRKRKSSMQRHFGLQPVSSRSMMVALAMMLPFCRCFAQDSTVSSSDDEKAAHHCLADLTAGEVRSEKFWYLERHGVFQGSWLLLLSNIELQICDASIS